MSNLLRQVTLDRSNRRKDKSVSLTFITDSEQSTEQFMEIDGLDATTGILYYKSHGTLTQQEVDELDAVDIELEGKTKSKRLRYVLHVVCAQELGRKPTEDEFKTYYSQRMEGFIQREKNKLD